MNAKGFLIDLDGTIYENGRLIAGAVDALDFLREHGIPWRFVTNTTRRSRRILARQLNEMGVAAEPGQLFTAPRAAAFRLKEQGVTNVMLCLPKECHEEFGAFSQDDRAPEAVVVGDLGGEWSYDILNRAFRHLLDGAKLIAIQKNRFWKTGDGVSLDAGPFVAALEYAADVEAEIVGKPSAAFFRAAAESMGLKIDKVAMIGDDRQSDVGGAQQAGAAGILVQTGKAKYGKPDPGITPSAELSSIKELPSLFS